MGQCSGSASTLFTTSQLQRARDECHQLTRDQLDMVVMGQLRAVCQSDSMTQKTKARNVKTKHTSTQYRFGGHRICQATFLFLHTMCATRFEHIKRSWLENGLTQRVRSAVLPHNTTRLSDIRHLVRYILQYAEQHAILLPGRIPGYKCDDVQLLPSSTTKRQVWEVYHQAAMESNDIKAVVKNRSFTLSYNSSNDSTGDPPCSHGFITQPFYSYTLALLNIYLSAHVIQNYVIMSNNEIHYQSITHSPR